MKRLKESGFRLRITPSSRVLSESQTVALAREADGVVAGIESWSRHVIVACPSLKVISRVGVGVDRIDFEAVHERKIKVQTTPDPIAEPVAELALTMILSLLRQIPVYTASMSRSRWQPVPGRLLAGKTIGIVGLGRIGKKMVQLLEPFGLTILVSETKPGRGFMRRHGLRLVTLKKLLSRSDIVTLHLAYSPLVKGLIGREQLGLMKRGSLLVNTARGGLVDHEALVWALRNRRIAGAALDVFETEPYRGVLSRLPNVITTPHVASFTEESRGAMEEQAVNSLLKELAR
ncbi:MAG: phosphoglycerate dehydrogenase [Candidatus Omnitrophica bacterium]|nr:phosphoglycerate dehydrogenase [Candidatus Omnitrophota bacterium]